jgi:hypothetical protein
MNELPEPADAADALAVALCHLQAERARTRFGLPDVRALLKPRAERLEPTHRPRGGATSGGLPRIVST